MREIGVGGAPSMTSADHLVGARLQSNWVSVERGGAFNAYAE
jgi:hypothetical protein